MRLDKVLSGAGFGSRKQVKKFILNKMVKVNNEVIVDSGYKVCINEDTIYVNSEKVCYREYIYIMINKPGGVITATWDKKQKTIMDLLPDNFKNRRLFPVGRLDKDTEGLIIVTNDGKLGYDLLSPKNHVSKKYHAIIEGFVTEDDVLKFNQGIIIDNTFKTMPAKLNVIKCHKQSIVEVTICEGKFHQIKKMFLSLGKKVLYLKRLSIGNIQLDNLLKPGDYREMSHGEIKLLKNHHN